MLRFSLAVLTVLCLLSTGAPVAESAAAEPPAPAETLRNSEPGVEQQRTVDDKLRRLIEAGEPEVSVLVVLRSQPQGEVLEQHENRQASKLKPLEARYAELLHTGRQTDPVIAEARDRLESEFLMVRRAAFEEILSLIQPEQESVAALIGELGGRVVYRYAAVNMLAAGLPATAVEQLAAHPAVARIALDEAASVKLVVSAPTLGAPSFWNAGYTGAGESVAVLDTGLKLDHPAFAGIPMVHRVFLSQGKTSPCFADQEASAADLHGHGTHVAGIVASRGAPGWSTYTGIARDLAVLYNLKVGFRKSSSPACANQGNFHASDVAAALDWAVRNAPLLKVFNYSAGATASFDDDDLARLFDFFADTYGLTFLVAAGNESNPNYAGPRTGPGPVSSPGIGYNVITVASMNTLGTPDRSDDQVSIFSSRGPTREGRKKPDLAAPGGFRDDQVQSGWQAFRGIYSPAHDSNEYVPMPGTSMAAPHIAGAVALLRQAGVRDALAIKALLLNSTDTLGWDAARGWGYANLNRAFVLRNNVITSSIPAGAVRFLKGNANGLFHATLAWNRTVNPARTQGCLSNLDLGLYHAGTGALVTGTNSWIDNVEQLNASVASDLVLSVQHLAQGSCRDSEKFAVALSHSGFDWATGAVLNLSCDVPGQVVPGSQFSVSCTVGNTGDLPAFAVTGQLALSGSPNPTAHSLGAIAPGSTVTRGWTFTAPATPGIYDLTLSAEGSSFGVRYANSAVFHVTAASTSSCTVTVSHLSLDVPASDSSVSVSVTAPSGCAWTATSRAAWITFQGNTQGTGNGSVTLLIAANGSTSPRTSTVTIGGQTITVRQAGADALPTQKRVLPQLAFGSSPALGNWTTELYFHNLTGGTAQVRVNFYGEDGSPLSVPRWGTSTTLRLAARGSDMIEISSTGPLLQGSVQLDLPDGVTGYGVFRQASAGLNPQEGVVPFSSSTSTRSTIVFNETDFVTAAALCNPGTEAVTVTATARDDAGGALGTFSINLAPRQRSAFVLRDRPELGSIRGRRGSIEFSAPGGSLSVLGLRFNGLAFTSILPIEQ